MTGWRVGAALAFFCLACPTLASEQNGRRFTCSDGTTFVVAVSGEVADVSFFRSERYRLQAKPFSLGQRFVSPTATLIIDGRFATFVSNRRLNLRSCFVVSTR